MKVYRFKCKNCGSKEYSKIDSNTYKCPYCGYKEEVFNDTKESPNALSEDDWTKINEQNINSTHTQATNNSFLMLLLCIFLGTMGVHKFMEGKIGTGILYLLTGGIFYVGWIIDIVDYANKYKRDKMIEKNK